MESFIKSCDKGCGGAVVAAKGCPTRRRHVLQWVTQLLVKLIIHPGAREGRRRTVTSWHLCALAHKHTGIFPEFLGKSEPVLLSEWATSERNCSGRAETAVIQHKKKHLVKCPLKNNDSIGLLAVLINIDYDHLPLSMPDVIPCNNHNIMLLYNNSVVWQ